MYRRVTLDNSSLPDYWNERKFTSTMKLRFMHLPPHKWAVLQIQNLKFKNQSKSSSLSSSSPPEMDVASSFSWCIASHRFNSDMIPFLMHPVVEDIVEFCFESLLSGVIWTRFRSPESRTSFSFAVKNMSSAQAAVACASFCCSARAASWAAAKDCCKSTGSYLCNAMRLHVHITLEATDRCKKKEI